MLDALQLRIARAALKWSINDLARAAGIPRNTISDFENGKIAGDRRKLAAIRRSLESAGVVFIADNGGDVGVRLRKRSIDSRAETETGRGAPLT